MNIKILDINTAIDDIKDIVKMDYDKFQNNFNVISSNNIEVYELLTTDIMELLIEYKEKNNISFDIIFNNDIIYFRFHTGPLFEPSMNAEGMKRESFLKYYVSLNLIKELSQKICKIYSDVNI